MSLLIYLLASILFAGGLGYIFTWNSSTVIELSGFAILILLMTLLFSASSEEKEQMRASESEFRSKLLRVLFFGGSALVFLPIFLVTPVAKNAILIFGLFIALYTTLGRVSLYLLTSKFVLSRFSIIKKVKLGVILYSVTAFGIVTGYIVNMFFPDQELVIYRVIEKISEL